MMAEEEAKSFEPGEVVQVADGPMKNVIGEVIACQENGEVIFKPTSVDLKQHVKLGVDQLEKYFK